MTADPTEPETFAEDEAQELGPEAPEADAAEQRTGLTPQDEEGPTVGDALNANEADLADQARVVELDEDDYR
jgi:hypothetical protein